MEILFSVLMAHYNNARFLGVSLKTVYDQTYTNWEVIIVEDGSTDNFEEVISAYKDDARIKVYRNEKNMGCSYTKAKCVEKATGEIAGFLDPDDTIHPDTLAIMVEAHLANPRCSIVHSTHYICDDKLNIIKLAEYPKALPVNTPYLLVNDGSIHHFVSFKKTCYNKTAGLSPIREYDKAIDQELYYILEETGEIFFINKPLYYYRIHKGSISNLGHEKQAMMEHYNIATKACLRRIEKLKKSNQLGASYWIKRYRTRYYKLTLLNSFRKKEWIPFLKSLVIFPFVGGMDNIISYITKLPKEGLPLIKRTIAGGQKVLD
ncbi:glycosyltransferase family 2 protein [Ferruginibacter sp.]